MRVSACKAALCCFIWHRSKTSEARRKPVEGLNILRLPPVLQSDNPLLTRHSRNVSPR